MTLRPMGRRGNAWGLPFESARSDSIAPGRASPLLHGLVLPRAHGRSVTRSGEGSARRTLAVHGARAGLSLRFRSALGHPRGNLRADPRSAGHRAAPPRSRPFQQPPRLARQRAYWTGYQFVEKVLWPKEQPTWTAGAILLAADALTDSTGAARLLTGAFQAPAPVDARFRSTPRVSKSPRDLKVSAL